MRKRVGLFPVLIIFGCVLIAFVFFSNKLVTRIAEADALYQQGVATGNNLEIRQNDLKETLASASSEAFIENQARSLYGYMKPDELRLVITNPEALYGTDGE